MGRAGDYPDYKEVYGFGGFRLLASRQETNIPLVGQNHGSGGHDSRKAKLPSVGQEGRPLHMAAFHRRP